MTQSQYKLPLVCVAAVCVKGVSLEFAVAIGVTGTVNVKTISIGNDFYIHHLFVHIISIIYLHI